MCIYIYIFIGYNYSEYATAVWHLPNSQRLAGLGQLSAAKAHWHIDVIDEEQHGLPGPVAPPRFLLITCCQPNKMHHVMIL